MQSTSTLQSPPDVTKLLIAGTHDQYPHPVSITSDYLDVVRIGIKTDFEVEVLRTGKRFAYVRGTPFSCALPPKRHLTSLKSIRLIQPLSSKTGNSSFPLTLSS